MVSYLGAEGVKVIVRLIGASVLLFVATGTLVDLSSSPAGALPRATPTLSTTPSPNPTLGATPVTLQDTAVLAGGTLITGSITFTLFYNGGTTPVDTETVSVSGNGTYTTPTGYTVPTTGTVTGTYQWDASYSGDTNNNRVSDDNNPDERTTVAPANPTLSMTPNPTSEVLGPAPPAPLQDSAVLTGSNTPTGSITFTLCVVEEFGCARVHTETFSVSGNGTYTTSSGYVPHLGTYRWVASYSGDSNNNPVSEGKGGVTVTTATISTLPQTVTLGTGPGILTDSASLTGGASPTGSITFTLFYNGGTAPIDTETVSVSGNGTYVTPNGFRIPTSGTVTGTYQWDASYSGDSNNNPASDNNNPYERAFVSSASPILSTTPSPTSVTLGLTSSPLKDTAVLSGGYRPTGSITFTLFSNGGSSPVDTETVSVSGNGTYSTPTGFTLPTSGRVCCTYQWDASYSGDSNNNPASETDNPNGRVGVEPASASLSTTPSPTSVTLGLTSSPLMDKAVLSGGYSPTGTITFTLYLNGALTPVDTETVTVSGDGTYSTPTGYTIVGGGTGTYQWDTFYSGDSNNFFSSDFNQGNEQVSVYGPPAGGARVAATSSGAGYWIVQADGGVTTYGDASSFGSLPGLGIHVDDIVGIAANPDPGYWLVGSDGGVFGFGDAPFFGSLPGLGIHVDDIVGIAVTADGGGYWLVARDGGVFGFGDAPFFGSMGGQPLNQPVVAMTPGPGDGYWLLASDGGVFSFGPAPFYGSMGGTPLSKPVVGLTGVPGGVGYWLVAGDGGVFSFGRAPFAGSLAGSPLPSPVIGLFNTNGGRGYTLVEEDGTAHAF